MLKKEFQNHLKNGLFYPLYYRYNLAGSGRLLSQICRKSPRNVFSVGQCNNLHYIWCIYLADFCISDGRTLLERKKARRTRKCFIENCILFPACIHSVSEQTGRSRLYCIVQRFCNIGGSGYCRRKSRIADKTPCRYL